MKRASVNYRVARAVALAVAKGVGAAQAGRAWAGGDSGLSAPPLRQVRSPRKANLTSLGGRIRPHSHPPRLRS